MYSAMMDQLLKISYTILLVSIPFSVGMNIGNHQVNFPSEWLMLFIALILIIKIFREKHVYHGYWRHPIVIASMIFLLWMALVIPLSTQVMTSLKYVFIEILHWWIFFIGFHTFYRISRGWTMNWFILLAIPMLFLVPYALVRFAQYDFRADAPVLLGQPFYSDHGLFSAVLVILLCYLSVQTFFLLRDRMSKKQVIFSTLTVMVLAGVVFLQSRGAWISLGLTTVLAGLFIVNRGRRTLPVIVVTSAMASVFILLLIVGRSTIKDDQNIVSRLSQDVATAERINRYRCAWRMFQERPWVGFGPGTFPQAYLPFQKPEEMTRISVTSPFRADGQPHQEGRGGGVHSEYLQALSERGVPGLLSWLVLIGISLIAAFKSMKQQTKSSEKMQVIGVTLGLLSFIIHALVNNYLHSEELAVLFWGGLGLIASLDLQRKDEAIDRT